VVKGGRKEGGKKDGAKKELGRSTPLSQWHNVPSVAVVVADQDVILKWIQILMSGTTFQNQSHFQPLTDPARARGARVINGCAFGAICQVDGVFV